MLDALSSQLERSIAKGLALQELIVKAGEWFLGAPKTPFRSRRRGSGGIAALPSSLLMGYLYQHFGAGLAFTVGAIRAAVSALLLLTLFRPLPAQT